MVKVGNNAERMPSWIASIHRFARRFLKHRSIIARWVACIYVLITSALSCNAIFFSDYKGPWDLIYYAYWPASVAGEYGHQLLEGVTSHYFLSKNVFKNATVSDLYDIFTFIIMGAAWYFFVAKTISFSFHSIRNRYRLGV